MSGWGSFSFAYGPLVAFVAVGLFALILRWAFSHGHSLVERRSAPGEEGDYGLLVTVAEPGTFMEAEVIRRTLVDHHIRATLAPTRQGPRVMVFPQDASIARAVLAAS